MRAIALRAECDDVLFEVDQRSYALVHLTWSEQRERGPRWRRTRILGDWALTKPLLDDHEYSTHFRV